ncbi:hypothetical protein C8J57DRAFT_1607445 [Mycena rebaudengoi]|nr:hypothetical protein C8J57DRAFT_1607445 [Mycena rebaudengoi]
MTLRAGLVFLLLSLVYPFFNFTLIHVQARVVPRINHLGQRATTLDTALSLASWIWLPKSDRIASTAPGTVAFVKVVDTPSGKTASSAVISLTAAADRFALWVNGQPIGGSGNDWRSAQVLRAALNGSVNVFSSIRVLHTDNTNTTFLSDSSWLAASTIPADFPHNFESNFAPSAVAGLYGTAPWGYRVSLPPAQSLDPLNLTGSNWIWSTPNATTSAAVETVGFRRTVVTPVGKVAESATILITVDNTFSFYVNGIFIGSPPHDPNFADTTSVWRYAQQFTVPLNATANTFTVIAQNFGGQLPGTTSSAGLIRGDQDLVQGWNERAGANRGCELAEWPLLDAARIPLHRRRGSSTLDVLDATRVPHNFLSAAPNMAAVAPAPPSVPVAAIVATVVCILAVVGLAGLLFWLRHRRKNAFPPPESEPKSNYSSVLHPIRETPPALAAAAANSDLDRPLPPLPSNKLDTEAARYGGADIFGPSRAEEVAPPPRYSIATEGRSSG